MYVLQAPVQLMDSGEVGELMAAIDALPEPPVLVIIDTLARCFVGGEENSAKEMGRFNAGVDQIRETGAAVLVLHHTDKTGRAERGSSALRGAVDTHMRVVKNGDQMILSCEKQKDADEFCDLAFALRVVDLEEGETSCVLEPVAVGERRTRMAAALTTGDKHIFEALDGKELTFTEWRKASGKSKGAFDRVRKKLVHLLLVSEVDGKYRRTKNTAGPSWRESIPATRERKRRAR